MALTDESNGGIGATMLVGPTGYGGGYPMMGGFGGGLGNGGDWWGILLLIALLNGGFGGWGGFGGFGGGYGAMMGMDCGLYPWLNNSQHISDGFRDQMLNTSVNSIGDKITSGFGDVATQLCGGFAGVNASINGAQNALAQQLYTNEIASLNRSFAEQTANTQGFTTVNSGIADTRYTIATEACATRNADAQNTNAVLNAVNAGVQSIKDQLCDYRNAQKDDIIAQLRQENLYARGQASQIAQNATIIDGVYNRLATCPVDTTPVYGRQPIFQCPVNVNGNNNGCGCSGNAFWN